MIRRTTDDDGDDKSNNTLAQSDCIMSVYIISSEAELYKNSQLKRLAMDKYSSRSLKVILILLNISKCINKSLP